MIICLFYTCSGAEQDALQTARINGLSGRRHSLDRDEALRISYSLFHLPRVKCLFGYCQSRLSGVT